ncbi:MAG: histidine--tRNA ligase [Nitrososphaerota archaeon]
MASGIRDEIYCFKDKSGRELGLRFDLTVGITRYVVSRRDLQLPVKLGSFGSMWRYDEPQYGRYRWFHQWDAEIFGPSCIEADAEVIDFTSSLFERLGIKDSIIRIGDRKVVEEFIRKELKIEKEELILEMLRALDKAGKKETSQILDEYEAKGIDRADLRRLMELTKLRGDAESVLKGLHQGIDTSSLSELSDRLRARGIKNFEIDLSIVRGLDYYTGTVFEAYTKEERLGAIAGGGRFDALPKIFGRQDMGATGVAGGVERTMMVLYQLQEKKGYEGPLIYVGYVGKDLMKPATEIASKLRREGLATDIELLNRSLRRQLEDASSKNIPFFVIVAPREYSQGKVLLRDMRKGEEAVLSIDELIGFLQQRLT